MLLEQFLPHSDVLKGILFGDVVNEDDALRIFEVGWDKTTVSLLACCVPHLQTIYFAVLGNVSYIEVYANCGLGKGIITLWVYSYLLVV